MDFARPSLTARSAALSTPSRNSRSDTSHSRDESISLAGAVTLRKVVQQRGRKRGTSSRRVGVTHGPAIRLGTLRLGLERRKFDCGARLQHRRPISGSSARSARGCERLEVDVCRTRRLVRDVGEPATIRRDLAEAFHESALGERRGRPTTLNRRSRLRPRCAHRLLGRRRSRRPRCASSRVRASA